MEGEAAVAILCIFLIFGTVLCAFFPTKYVACICCICCFAGGADDALDCYEKPCSDDDCAVVYLAWVVVRFAYWLALVIWNVIARFLRFVLVGWWCDNKRPCCIDSANDSDLLCLETEDALCCFYHPNKNKCCGFIPCCCEADNWGCWKSTLCQDEAVRVAPAPAPSPPSPQVYSFCPSFVSRVMYHLIEYIMNEISRLFQCVPDFCHDGAVQGRLEIYALDAALGYYKTDETVSALKEALNCIPEIENEDERGVRELLHRFKTHHKFMLTCFQPDKRVRNSQFY